MTPPLRAHDHAADEADARRFRFLITCLNEDGSFRAFSIKWVPGIFAPVDAASLATWRAAIDRVMHSAGEGL